MQVVCFFQKLLGYAKLGCLTAESKKEIDDFLVSSRELPKAPWEEGVCKVCGVDKDDYSVLLCDKCDAEYHTYCLSPPLASIPQGTGIVPLVLLTSIMFEMHQNVLRSFPVAIKSPMEKLLVFTWMESHI